MKRLVLLVVSLFASAIVLIAQPKESSCGTSCFKTEVISITPDANGCRDYELRVYYDGKCKHALSHVTVEVPCGEIKNVWNSEQWKQETGTDPKTGLTGFKIDDIREFGETNLTEFTVKFTVCSSDTCSTGNCWTPKVAYKAGTCVYYENTSFVCQSLKASIDKRDITCNGGADGSLAVAVHEGTPPFAYRWSTGATSPGIENLSGGHYSVVVTDASGQSITLSARIHEPEKIEIAATVNPVTCAGYANGSIELQVTGGNAPYRFLWSTRDTTQHITNIRAGNYSVTVTDSAACTASASFTISTLSSISIKIAATQPNCNDSNGSLDITVTGGIEPYAYSWSNGAVTEDLVDIGAGLYTVTVTDSIGCVRQSSYWLKEINTLALSASVKQTSCADDASGEIDLTVKGGTPPYTYAWSNSSTTEDLTGLTAGFYTVTVTDTSTCTATLRANVSKKALLVETDIQQPTCHNAHDGSIEVTPSGGTEPYTYKWSNNETTAKITGLAPGVYSVDITDAAGCTKRMIYVISNPPAITVTHRITTTSCLGDSQYAIDITVEGGTGTYTYAWSNGSTEEDLLNVAEGTYTITVTDENGCTATVSIDVEPGAAGSLSCTISEPDTNPVCGSTGNTLTAIADAESYSWHVSGEGWTITSDTTSSSIIYQAGAERTSATFTLTITKNGCSTTCQVTITSCTVDNENDNDNDDPTDPDTGSDPNDPDDDSDSNDPGNGGSDPNDPQDPMDPDNGNDPANPDNGSGCDECFNTAIVNVTTSGSCRTYEIEVSTNGYCRYELSHWVIGIPCGTISSPWNSEGWKMEIGKDPTTGLYGLKVDDIEDFGKTPDSFTVKFTLCADNVCADQLAGWNPVAAYKAGQCVATEDAETSTTSVASGVHVFAYPNPFQSTLTFEWKADSNDYVSLDILDPRGMPVARVFELRVSKNEHYKFDWTAAGLKETFYIYRFTSSKGVQYGKVFRMN